MRANSRFRTFAVIAAVSCATLFVGCDGPTVLRDPVDGMFVLRTVGSNLLPAVTGTALDHEFIALADTVILRADGTGERRRTTERRNINTDARDTSHTQLSFDHERRGDSVRATNITCEPMCEALPNWAQYVLDGEWLILGPGSGAHRFERVGPAPPI
jgi:hypothetical protein